MNRPTNLHHPAQPGQTQPTRRLALLKTSATILPITLLLLASCMCAGTLPSDGSCHTSPYQWERADSPTGYDCLLATVTANPAIVKCVDDKGAACKDDDKAPQCFSDCASATDAPVNKSKPLSTPFAPPTQGPSYFPIVPTSSAAKCEPGWLPDSGCACCGTTLVCHDGTVAAFNPACGVGGGNTCSCGDGTCDAACGENISSCAADCHK